MDQGATMNNEHQDETRPSTDDDGAELRSSNHPPRKLQASALFNGAALLSTTAVVIADQPKLPPYQGD